MSISAPKNGGRSRPKVSLADVARAAGMSTTAVSYALTGRGTLSVVKREMIIKTARELGYESNYFAQHLKVEFRDVVALCAGVDLGVGTMKIWEIQHRLDLAGYKVEVYVSPVYVAHEGEQQMELLQTVRRLKPRAIICEISSMRAGLEAGGYEELQRYIESGGILVCYGCNASDDLHCDKVLYDEAHSAYLMGKHLLEMGHRELGFCVHDNNPRPGHPHVKGFLRALEEAGIETNRKWIWGECCQEEGGARLAERFAALPKTQRPTALGIINDVSASAFVNAMTRNGYKIPDDLSLIGHDDVPAAACCLVPLSTISHSSQTQAAELVEMVLSRFEGRAVGAPRTVAVRGEIIRRDSVLPR